MAAVVLERLVQQEHLPGAEAQRLEAAAQDAVGGAVQAAGDEGVEVLRAEVDLHRLAGVQREGQVAYGAEVVAHGAAGVAQLLDERVALAQDELLLAVRADDVVADAVPRTA